VAGEKAKVRPGDGAEDTPKRGSGPAVPACVVRGKNEGASHRDLGEQATDCRRKLECAPDGGHVADAARLPAGSHDSGARAKNHRGDGILPRPAHVRHLPPRSNNTEMQLEDKMQSICEYESQY
jgi:hypothetical protein